MTDTETVERVAAILEGGRVCVNCRFYTRKDSIYTDICEHPKALHDKQASEDNGVRELPRKETKQYVCYVMRAGICGEKAKLFEPKE
jgi:hypothetical protein